MSNAALFALIALLLIMAAMMFFGMRRNQRQRKLEQLQKEREARNKERQQRKERQRKLQKYDEFAQRNVPPLKTCSGPYDGGVKVHIHEYDDDSAILASARCAHENEWQKLKGWLERLNISIADWRVVDDLPPSINSREEAAEEEVWDHSPYVWSNNIVFDNRYACWSRFCHMPGFSQYIENCLDNGIHEITAHTFEEFNWFFNDEHPGLYEWRRRRDMDREAQRRWERQWGQKQKEEPDTECVEVRANSVYVNQSPATEPKSIVTP